VAKAEVKINVNVNVNQLRAVTEAVQWFAGRLSAAASELETALDSLDSDILATLQETEE
jgi:hypothetical protein